MKKKLTCLLAMLIILAGCNNNDDATPVQHKTDNSGIKGHFKDFPELESLFDKAMPKNNSGHGNAKAKAVGIYDFKIDSTFITKRVGPKGTSYTMAIYRDSTYKFIENLIICDRGNFTEAYIMSYFPENEFEKKENAQYHFIGGMSLAKIDYGKVPKSGLGCASVTVTYCDYSEDGTPNTHVAGPNCGTTYNITTTLCHGILTSDYFNPEMQPMQFIRATRGSGGGSSSNPTPPNSTDFNLTTQPQLTLSEAALFSRSLSATQKVFWNNTANATIVTQLKNYLNSKNYSSESKSFVKQFIDAYLVSGLNLNVIKSAASPCNIDMTAVSGNSPEEIRFNSVYSKLMASTLFKQMLASIFEDSSRYNIKFKIGNVTNPNNEGETKPLRLSSTNVYNEITLRTDFVNEASEVRIATVIIHEIIHAFLNVTRVNPDLGLTIQALSTKDFAACINSCYDGLNGPMPQHNFMTDYMGPVISEILSEIKSSLFTAAQINRVEHPQLYNNYYLYAPTNTIPPTMSSIVVPWVWNDFIWYQSFQGLDSCASFNAIFESNSVAKYYYNKYLTVANIAFAF